MIAVGLGVYIAKSNNLLTNNVNESEGKNQERLVPVPSPETSYDRISDDELQNKREAALSEIESRRQLCQKASDEFFKDRGNTQVPGVKAKVLADRLRYLFKNTLHSTGEAKSLTYTNKLIERKSGLINPDEVYETLAKQGACRDPRASEYLRDVFSEFNKIEGTQQEKEELRAIMVYSLQRLLNKDFRTANLTFIMEKLNQMASEELLQSNIKERIYKINSQIHQEFNQFKGEYSREVTSRKKLEALQKHFASNQIITGELNALLQAELDQLENQIKTP